MGLRERLQQATGATPSDPPPQDEDAPIVLPTAWKPGSRPTGAVMLRSLGYSGFGLRDPDTGDALRRDDPALLELGVVVAPLHEIADRRDDRRLLASEPGSRLTLVAESGRIVVYDHSGELDIGELDRDQSRSVMAALDGGADLRALSVWETTAMNQMRTGLDILIAPSSVEVIFEADHSSAFAD